MFKNVQIKYCTISVRDGLTGGPANPEGPVGPDSPRSPYKKIKLLVTGSQVKVKCVLLELSW